MRLINRGRGNGKTSMLISTAYVTGVPIITSTNAHRNIIWDTAYKMNVQDNIDVYTIEEWQKIPHHNDKVLVDDVNLIIGQILSNYLKAEIVAGTMTIPMDDKKETNNDITHGHWNVLDECANEGVYCSCCHKKIYKLYYANQKLKSKYCPNCGALMDE